VPPDGRSGMRAWFTSGDGIDALESRTVPIPSPGKTEVLLRISALSLNFRDLLVVNGVDTWKPESPVVPISDAVGTVVATGDDVTRFTAGDRVLPIFLPKWRTGALTAENYVSPVGGPVNRGFLAGFAAVDEQEAVRAPNALPDVEAATLPIAGVTAWHAVARTGVSGDETVLVHGTGGVALFALQIAHAMGASVIVTSSDDAKLERARAMGARATINYRSEDVAEAVRRITGQRGVEVVIETVGGRNLDLSLEASAVGARIAFVGMIGGQSASVDTYRFVQRHVTLHGIETGSREMLEDLVAFVEQTEIHPVIDRTFSARDVQTALGHLQRAGHFGKLVLDASDGW
jgi:NADPH:quinone reductase-like Zn-dependent oxidoreductase